VQVLAVLDITYLAASTYKPFKVLRDIAFAPQPSDTQSDQVGGRQITLTHAMLHVELIARGLASASQTAIVWVVSWSPGINTFRRSIAYFGFCTLGVLYFWDLILRGFMLYSLF